MTYAQQLKEHTEKSRKIFDGLCQDAIDGIAVATDAVEALNNELVLVTLTTGVSPHELLEDKVRSLAKLIGLELVGSNNTNRQKKKKAPAKKGRGRPKGSKNKPKKKVAKRKVEKKVSKKIVKKKAPAKKGRGRPKAQKNKPKKKKS